MPDFYLGVNPDSENYGTVWKFEDGVAIRVDVPQQIEILSGTPPNVVLKNFPALAFTRLKIVPGEYYRRIARRPSGHLRELPGLNPDTESLRAPIEVSNGQLIALADQLEQICRVVHPDDSTLEVFGHDIRNLLILAATEVETHWKAVLTANGAKADNTHDYVKLSIPLHLSEYEISLPYYPWLKPIRPFENWRQSKSPTKDLTWYDAYNAVKHDRELNFHRATLRNAISAICGNYVMMCAQFGMPNYWCRRRELHSFFHLRSGPKWDLDETYSKAQGEPWRAVNYPF